MIHEIKFQHFYLKIKVIKEDKREKNWNFELPVKMGSCCSVSVEHILAISSFKVPSRPYLE